MKPIANTVSEKVYLRRKITLPEKDQEQKKSLLLHLRNYIKKENDSENHFKWIGTAMIVQAVIITPLVAFVLTQTGNNPLLWFFCTAAMFMTFVPGLSGLSVKAVLSTFLVSMIINIMIVIAAIAIHVFF